MAMFVFLMLFVVQMGIVYVVLVSMEMDWKDVKV